MTPVSNLHEQHLSACLAVGLFSSGTAFGSRTVPSPEVDAAFAMPHGKLRNRAGIESLAYVREGENEVSLGSEAVRIALQPYPGMAQQIDFLVATSETHHNYPSLAAELHAALTLRESCGALDVGGACLGLLNALSVAQSLIRSRRASVVAVVTADVHSRSLGPGRVPGEFGGLFGDGASAFLLRGQHTPNLPDAAYTLGEFFFGCAAQYSAAIRVQDRLDGSLGIRFDGEALSRAAITRMEKVIESIEVRSGIGRTHVGAFATHQPNPRLVALLAKQCRVSPKAFAPVARLRGNLGSSTCGAALHVALEQLNREVADFRRPIFLASLGPGLLFGGGWLTPATAESA